MAITKTETAICESTLVPRPLRSIHCGDRSMFQYFVVSGEPLRSRIAKFQRDLDVFC
jgi:hypothetical protein